MIDIDAEDQELDDASLAISPLVFDPDKYRDGIAELGLTTEQENDMLEALWHIMKTFVEMGWGVDTVQLFLPELFEKPGLDSGNLVDSKPAKK